MRSDKFNRCVKETLMIETGGDLKDGGYTDDPDDAGRATRWGISKKSYPQVDIETLTRYEAEEIYHKDFWNKYYDLLPVEVAFKLFDLGVLFGVRTTVKAFQRAIAETAMVHLTLDGVFGAMSSTGASIAISMDKHGELLANFKQIMRNRVNFLMARPQNWKYRKGWMARIDIDPKFKQVLVM